MDWQVFRVCVAPGDAVVVREGAVVLVADPIGDPQEEFLDRLLSLLGDAAQQLNPASGETLRRVAALVTSTQPEEVPSLGLLTSVNDGMVALLVDRMRLRVFRSGVIEELGGDEATTFVERKLRGGFDRLLMSAIPDDVEPDVRSNLNGGVVRGAGVMLIPATRTGPVDEPEETMVDLALAVPEPLPEPEPSPEVSYTPISLTEPEQPSVVAADPEPDPEPEPDPVREPVQVQGIVCSRGHFTRHDARFCSQCGISMVHQTHNVIMGYRPPLGVLVIDDGSVFSLNGDYVVGRDPAAADAVTSGEATALQLDDEGGSMSRVHARILLDGWEVRVVDANSANGSFLATSGGLEWIRLEPGVPHTIEPGTRLSMGGRTLTFESHQRL